VEKMMNGNWKKTAMKVTLWIAAEITLNLVGLDGIADYTEFVFSRQGLSLSAINAMNPPLLG
jgi:hypothetical protein